MAKYKILIKESAAKELGNIPGKRVKNSVKKIQSPAEESRPHGVYKHCTQERHRIRNGDYRIVYSIEDENSTVYICKIGHRREVYR